MAATGNDARSSHPSLQLHGQMEGDRTDMPSAHRYHHVAILQDISECQM
jgi:hypothetical protein